MLKLNYFFFISCFGGAYPTLATNFFLNERNHEKLVSGYVKNIPNEIKDLIHEYYGKENRWLISNTFESKNKESARELNFIKIKMVKGNLKNQNQFPDSLIAIFTEDEVDKSNLNGRKKNKILLIDQKKTINCKVSHAYNSLPIFHYKWERWSIGNTIGEEVELIRCSSHDLIAISYANNKVDIYNTRTKEMETTLLFNEAVISIKWDEKDLIAISYGNNVDIYNTCTKEMGKTLPFTGAIDSITWVKKDLLAINYDNNVVMYNTRTKEIEEKFLLNGKVNFIRWAKKDLIAIVSKNVFGSKVDIYNTRTKKPKETLLFNEEIDSIMWAKKDLIAISFKYKMDIYNTRTKEKKKLLDLNLYGTEINDVAWSSSNLLAISYGCGVDIFCEIGDTWQMIDRLRPLEPIKNLDWYFDEDILLATGNKTVQIYSLGTIHETAISKK